MAKKLINTILDWGANLILISFAIISIWVIIQVFFFASFRIPSDSMEPVLTTGDNILVFKPTIGARVFNVFASMRNEQTEIHRVSGVKRVKRNDVLVFNFPHPNNWDTIEMHILKYYIKRCVGLPGDTLSIRNGFYHIEGIDVPLGNRESQKIIASTDKFGDGIFNSFPYDSVIHWNIKNFGPLYVPAKGDSIVFNRTNYILYKKIIEWEQKGNLQYKDSTILLNGKPIEGYRFKKNYYFMAGDNGINSQDSRYWGLLPEEYIVGKAWIIWKSVDPYTNEFRWDRFMKVIK